MKTAGQILNLTRLGRKLELAEIARITKIRSEFLSALEADDYTRLPHGATARGFIRNYSEFLGLKPEYVLAVFRRDFVENSLGHIVPRAVSSPSTPASFWTPRTTIVAVVTTIFLLFGLYLFYQYRLFTGPPGLKVTHPPESLITSKDTVEVSGATDPEATISINGQLVALDKGGLFFLRLPLNPGPNSITVTAASKTGKTTTLTRTVTLTASPK